MSSSIERSEGHRGTHIYYLVYGALMVLLVLTVAAASWELGAIWGLIVAMSIAAVKALLVILYFMHVRESSRVTWLFVAAGFVWLAILLGLIMTDYLTRGWLSA